VNAAVRHGRRVDVDANPVRRHCGDAIGSDLDAVVALQHVANRCKPRQRRGVAGGDGVERGDVVRRQRGDEPRRCLVDLRGSSGGNDEQNEERRSPDHE
jgi:hypothetical protein